MDIETKIPCPKCGTIIDIKEIKELIINKIVEFIRKKNNKEIKEIS